MLHQTSVTLLLLTAFQCLQLAYHRDHPRATSVVEYASSLKLCTGYNFIKRIRLLKYPLLKQGHTIILLILSLCGDIELNPGPGNASIYPCGCCEWIVNCSQKAVCCDDCSIWYHMICNSMCSIDYEGIWSTSWRCCNCNSIIRDFRTYHSYTLPVSNSFNALLSIPSDSDVVFQHSAVSLSSPQMPIRHSTPQPTTTATWATSVISHALQAARTMLHMTLRRWASQVMPMWYHSSSRTIYG